MTPSAAEVSAPRPTSSTRAKHQHLRRNLRNSIAEGSAFNLMVGMGETYFPAFVLALGLGEVAAGLVSTIPLVAGACLQLFAPLMVARLRSYRRWVLFCASVQALAFLPLVAGAFLGRLPLATVFLIAAVYWGFGMGSGPAWNSWMGTLVPCRMQTSFFTRRSLWTQVTALCGFLAGGIALRGWHGPTPTQVFAGLFTVAFFCRVLSIHWLSGQSEPVPPLGSRVHPASPFRALARRLQPGEPLGRVLCYLLAVQLTTQIASPFFTPFMLGELHLNYTQYAVLIGSSYLTKILVLPRLGRLALAHGTRTLLWLGGVGMVILPALWLVSHSYGYLILLQVMSGVFWASYDLAALLLIFELIPAEERTPLLSGYNFANALCVVSGSAFGGWILHTLGPGIDTYVTIFLLSSIGRAATLWWLRRIAEQRTDWVPPVLRPLVVRPSFGFQGTPLGFVPGKATVLRVARRFRTPSAGGSPETGLESAR